MIQDGRTLPECLWMRACWRSRLRYDVRRYVDDEALEARAVFQFRRMLDRRPRP